MTREVWITGTGLISALGEGEAEHWAALAEPASLPAPDTTLVAPFAIHPMKPLTLSRHIPNKSDQRAMGPFMHFGAYAAGMALADAGIAGDKSLLARTHLIVGCGGGERDEAVDEKLLAGLPKAAAPGRFLNDTLMTELRPTLFLAQLPNLFAGNISIVHGVTGSSCTFMGEEMAGVDAVRVAFERCQTGQGDVFLVGSAFNAERKDLALLFAAGGFLARGTPGSLWGRPKAGMVLGSMGAFAVIEARAHAQARGRTPIARLTHVEAGRSDRTRGAATRVALGQWNAIRRWRDSAPLGVLSGASGVGPITAEEHAFLESLGDFPVRGTGRAFGHGLECAFVANLVLAAAAARRQTLFAPCNAEDPLERPATAPLRQILVTQWGHYRGEGMALVEHAG